MYKECIKNCNEALTYVKENPKAYYRIAQAYKETADLDRAQENFKIAIQMAPNDKGLRNEYKKLMDLKGAKEKEWYGKM